MFMQCLLNLCVDIELSKECWEILGMKPAKFSARGVLQCIHKNSSNQGACVWGGGEEDLSAAQSFSQQPVKVYRQSGCCRSAGQLMRISPLVRFLLRVLFGRTLARAWGRTLNAPPDASWKSTLTLGGCFERGSKEHQGCCDKYVTAIFTAQEQLTKIISIENVLYFA